MLMPGCVQLTSNNFNVHLFNAHPNTLFSFLAITCREPDAPQYGRRTGNVFTAGSSVSFSCDVGYKIVGTSRLVCQNNGQWDNRVPRCIGGCTRFFGLVTKICDHFEGIAQWFEAMSLGFIISNSSEMVSIPLMVWIANRYWCWLPLLGVIWISIKYQTNLS